MKVLATKIKCAVASALVSLFFVSQVSAVLRPLFPIKPAAPVGGEYIVVDDELVLRSVKKPRLNIKVRNTSHRLD